MPVDAKRGLSIFDAAITECESEACESFASSNDRPRAQSASHFIFRCPSCYMQMRLSRALIGKEGKCHHCSAVTTLTEHTATPGQQRPEQPVGLFTYLNLFARLAFGVSMFCIYASPTGPEVMPLFLLMCSAGLFSVWTFQLGTSDGQKIFFHRPWAVPMKITSASRQFLILGYTKGVLKSRWWAWKFISCELEVPEGSTDEKALLEIKDLLLSVGYEKLGPRNRRLNAFVNKFVSASVNDEQSKYYWGNTLCWAAGRWWQKGRHNTTISVLRPRVIKLTGFTKGPYKRPYWSHVVAELDEDK